MTIHKQREKCFVFNIPLATNAGLDHKIWYLVLGTESQRLPSATTDSHPMKLEYLQSILDSASTELLKLAESHDDLSSPPPLYPPQLAPQARVPTALTQLYEKRQVSFTLALVKLLFEE